VTRRAADPGIRISISTVRIVLAVVVAILVLAAIFGIVTVVHANEPIAVATATQMKVQQTAAERDVERAYEQAVEQVRKIRALNLAITAAQADQISGKARSDLRTLRHSAFVSLGQMLNMTAAEAEVYSTATETRFDQAPVATQSPSPSPVLLAPRFYTVVSRMSELATLLADQATTQLTAPPPSAAPTATPTATPTTRPSGAPSPSPSR
jgi:hypothetical protein